MCRYAFIDYVDSVSAKVAFAENLCSVPVLHGHQLVVLYYADQIDGVKKTPAYKETATTARRQRQSPRSGGGGGATGTDVHTRGWSRVGSYMRWGGHTRRGGTHVGGHMCGWSHTGGSHTRGGGSQISPNQVESTHNLSPNHCSKVDKLLC